MKKLLIATVLFLTISACKPIEQEEIIQYPINEELKTYFGSFKEGSWWIYQDTVSGRLDTFTVVKYIGEVKSVCYLEEDGKDIFATYLYYKIEHGLTSYSPFMSYRITSNCELPEETIVIIDYGPAQGSLNLKFDDDGFFDEWISSNQDTVSVSFHSNYLLNNINYSDVYYIKQSGDASFYADYNYIIAKNIGIIGFNAKNYFDDNWKAYWVLIDKNIVL